MWLEDVLRVDNVETLADFRRQSGMPIAASEMLLGRASILAVLNARAADYVMIDPSWAGGISETRRIIDLAQTYNIPATMHDCTGPLTLFSGLHLRGCVGQRRISGNRTRTHSHILRAAHRSAAANRERPTALAHRSGSRHGTATGTISAGTESLSMQ